MAQTTQETHHSVDPDLQWEHSDRIAVPTLSRNAQKRARKAERYAAQKLERRAREKETKKEKKRALAEKRAAGELDEHEKLERNKRKRVKVSGSSESFGSQVIVDLGFDNMMSEKEIISLCSQLAYCYSANRRAGFPFALVYTSLDGRTLTRLEGMNDAGYKRWDRTEWWQEGYERLWMKLADGEEAENTKRNIVYLTADSEQELTELKKHETYIIGGICDHNRHKNLCLNKATASGICSARLPIGRYLASLPTRKVLTINQVFEILVHWVETRDWEQAFHIVIPKRKFQNGGQGKGRPNKEDGSEAGVEDGDSEGHQGDEETT